MIDADGLLMSTDAVANKHSQISSAITKSRYKQTPWLFDWMSEIQIDSAICI